jgi:hypothetical protein
VTPSWNLLVSLARGQLISNLIRGRVGQICRELLARYCIFLVDERSMPFIRIVFKILCEHFQKAFPQARAPLWGKNLGRFQFAKMQSLPDWRMPFTISTF